MSEKGATGGCLCGAVRYQIHGALRDVLICHCDFCQRLHTHAGAYAACAPADLELTERSQLRWYPSSPEAERGFCGSCGAGLFWRPSHGNHISVSVGSLDDPSSLRLLGHIFTACALHLYPIPETARRWDRGSD